MNDRPDIDTLLPGLASRIKLRRQERGLTQNALARELNITFQAVSKWERGENAPELTLIPRLADALNVSTDWLLGAQLQHFARECYLFAGLSDSQIRTILRLFRPIEYTAEEIIYAEQPEPNRGGLYLIESGRVRFFKENRHLADLGPGEIFSDYSLFDGGPTVTRAHMLKDGVVHSLSLASFQDYKSKHESETVRLLLNEITRLAGWHREHD